jgi:hypothetical protein
VLVKDQEFLDQRQNMHKDDSRFESRRGSIVIQMYQQIYLSKEGRKILDQKPALAEQIANYVIKDAAEERAGRRHTEQGFDLRTPVPKPARDVLLKRLPKTIEPTARVANWIDLLIRQDERAIDQAIALAEPLPSDSFGAKDLLLDIKESFLAHPKAATPERMARIKKISPGYAEEIEKELVDRGAKE